MNWREAIAGLNVCDLKQSYADIERFSSELGLCAFDGWLEFEQRVKKYWVSKWLCTDITVGLAVYMMDGEPVAVSGRQARKADENIQFVSREAGIKVRDFILSLQRCEEIDVADLDAEIDPAWFNRGN